MSTFKRSLSLILCVVMLFSMIVFEKSGRFSMQASAFLWSTGDIIEYGSYPQSVILDPMLLSVLNKKSSNIGWWYYDYYVGKGIEYYGKGTMYQSNYMSYCDVTYEGSKYRGVKFTQYRPYFTDYTSQNTYTYQDDNGYRCNTTYWFKYEPIQWRILDTSTGLVVADRILDSQAFNDYMIYNEKDGEFYGDAAKKKYAGLFESSSIRTWLNVDFFALAFEDSDTNNIKYTTLDNTNMVGTKGGDEPYINGPSTTDRVFLLSYADVQNKKYSLNPIVAKGTPYAASQGLHMYTQDEIIDAADIKYAGFSTYRLRTPKDTDAARVVNFNGELNYLFSVHDTSVGIRPAMCLKQIKSEAGFTVGRDNNSFLNSSNSEKYKDAGFADVKNYYISNEKLRNQLKSFASTDDQIDKKLSEKWDGSCYGMAATMGLAYIEQLPAVNNKGWYHDMPYPSKNKDFLDAIQYYQLAGGVSAYQKYNFTYWNPQKNKGKFKSDFNTLPQFFNYLLETLQQHGIAQFSFGYRDAMEYVGHSVIVYGYILKENGALQFRLYDENHYKQTTLFVSADKKTFYFTDGLGLTHDQDSFRYLSCYDLYNYALVEQNTKSAVSASSADDTYTITISDSEDFDIRSADGKFLTCSDGVLNTDMDIVDMKPIVNSSEGKDTYQIRVRSTPQIAFKPSGSSDITLCSSKAYLHLTAENMDSADICLGDSVKISGSSCSYETAFGFNNTEDTVYRFSAAQSGSTNISFSESKVDVSSDKQLKNVSLEKAEADKEAKRYACSASNHIRVQSDERIYDGSTLVYDPNAKAPNISIRNYKNEITVKCATEVNLFADVENAPQDASLKWYGWYRDESGKIQLTTLECALNESARLIITKDYEVYVCLIDKSGNNLAESQKEIIHMKEPRIFPNLIKLIRLLLANIGIRAKYVQ